MSNCEQDCSDLNQNEDKGLLAKLDINAWRKRQSITNGSNPLFQRRLSQGENIHSIDSRKTTVRSVFIEVFILVF